MLLAKYIIRDSVDFNINETPERKEKVGVNQSQGVNYLDKTLFWVKLALCKISKRLYLVNTNYLQVITSILKRLTSNELSF